MKEIYIVLLQFIETTDKSDCAFKELFTILEKQEIKERENNYQNINYIGWQRSL